MHKGLTTRKAALGSASLRVAVAALAVSIIGAASAASAHRTSGAIVKTRSTSLGRILVNSRGHSLYLFEKDKRGRSACYAACAKFWPPLLTSGKPIAGPGAKGSLLRTTTRTGGARQVTYAGHPLYRYALDKRAGQTKGEGSKAFGAEWYVLAPTGKKIDKG
jgi:predicted lipoprotein with Yx(FWY)xxD motif